ncbi:MAG: acyltransferase family protein [Deltaproteobacteria bacterium]|nr:acyltransferase family protein [Deltaproteobacteria bacterium]
MEFRDAGHGYDVFGLHPPTLDKTLSFLRPIYDRYFSVRTSGVHNIPADGSVLVVANHSGVLPIDGFIAAMSVYFETGRFARVIVDHFVPLWPLVGTLFSRLGAIGGSRGNLAHLLDNDALVVVFPEGISGPGKDPADRYQLQQWRVGHAEFAIRHRATVVPAAIIGAEEAWPIWKKVRSFGLLGAPYLPIPASLWPRKVPFHIVYGEPIELHAGTEPEDADDPRIVEAAAERSRVAVQALVDRHRPGGAP